MERLVLQPRTDAAAAPGATDLTRRLRLLSHRGVPLQERGRQVDDGTRDQPEERTEQQRPEEPLPEPLEPFVREGLQGDLGEKSAVAHEIADLDRKRRDKRREGDLARGDRRDPVQAQEPGGDQDREGVYADQRQRADENADRPGQRQFPGRGVLGEQDAHGSQRVQRRDTFRLEGGERVVRPGEHGPHREAGVQMADAGVVVQLVEVRHAVRRVDHGDFHLAQRHLGPGRPHEHFVLEGEAGLAQRQLEQHGDRIDAKPAQGVAEDRLRSAPAARSSRTTGRSARSRGHRRRNGACRPPAPEAPPAAGAGSSAGRPGRAGRPRRWSPDASCRAGAPRARRSGWPAPCRGCARAAAAAPAAPPGSRPRRRCCRRRRRARRGGRPARAAPRRAACGRGCRRGSRPGAVPARCPSV